MDEIYFKTGRPDLIVRPLKQEKGLNMKTEPLISIIIPVYNVEKYLDKCLCSVRRQTYTNLEILLINDASTDQSGKICDAYMGQDARFRVIHLTQNKGVSHARNVGMEQALGDYIGFVDSDDYIEKDMFERLYKNLREHQADISICGVKRIGFGKFSKIRQADTPCVLSGQEAIVAMINEQIFGWEVYSKLFVRSSIMEYRFHEKIHCGEDVLFSYQVFQAGGHISYLPDKLYNYVFRDNGAMRGKFSERRYTEFLVYEFLYEDSKVQYPELLTSIREKILNINIRFAVNIIESGEIRGKELFRYLRKFRANIRRYYNREALLLLEFRKIAAEVVLLYCSAEIFWFVVVIYKRIRRLFVGHTF